MNVALAHDSLTQYGGAERVLEALHELYPEAPVFTLVYDKRLAGHFEGWTIVSSPLQYIYKLLPKFQWLLPLIPWALNRFDFSEFDLVISSSSVFMKNITVPETTVHVNYCHTPARFLWLNLDSYVDEELPRVLRPFAPFVKLYLRRLRRWDFNAAQRVNYFVANSKNTQQRIKKFYNRDSTVVYPFVDLELFYPSKPKENYYLLAGRLQKHKRADVVVEAFNRLGLPLHVVGAGRAEPSLRAAAKPNVTFLGKVPNEVLRSEYSGALALIFPQEEDFGIVPLEAFACGTPVIAYAKGGALETVTPQTGVFFEEQTPEAVQRVVRDFNPAMFFSEDLFDRAQQFSKETFKRAFADVVEANVSEERRQSGATEGQL